MGKNKLPKFAEMTTFSNVIQVPFHLIGTADHPLKGNWNRDFFQNDNPIVLELGCGKGEYTVGLARIHPECNYIGIDIKGARMYTGARQAIEENLSNVAFLRTHVEMAGQFFGPGEVDSIWLTFPDPQMKKTRKRLTSTRFIGYYRHFLKPGGAIHLKTDSNFQYQYTLGMMEANQFELVMRYDNLYAEPLLDDALKIKTYYENQWATQGISIKYLSFIPHQDELLEPELDIEPDPYRSSGRGVLFNS